MPSDYDGPRAAAHAEMGAERTRIGVILAMPEARGEQRELAEHFAAYHNTLDPEVIRGCLTAAQRDHKRAQTPDPESAPSTASVLAGQGLGRGSVPGRRLGAAASRTRCEPGFLEGTTQMQTDPGQTDPRAEVAAQLAAAIAIY